MTDTHTQRALLNDKKLTPVAPHVLLSLLVITLPSQDVLPIIWTDYTYDSEHGIAEGVSLAFFDAAQVPGGELRLFGWLDGKCVCMLSKLPKTNK